MSILQNSVNSRLALVENIPAEQPLALNDGAAKRLATAVSKCKVENQQNIELLKHDNGIPIVDVLEPALKMRLRQTIKLENRIGINHTEQTLEQGTKVLATPNGPD